MTTTFPIHKASERYIDPEENAFRRRNAEPSQDPALAEAEEEEMAELWASDRGNQGA